MIYKDLVALLIIFALLLTIGVRMVERGLYNVMGLEIEPKSFDMEIQSDRTYVFRILGNDLSFQNCYKIGEISASRGFISIKMLGKSFRINSLLNTGVMLKRPLNLDKKSADMYN